MLTVGLFIAQIVGVYITYYWLAMILLAFMAILVPFVMTIKETPQWLLTQGRRSEAVKTLKWLYGPNCNISEEIQKIEEAILSTKKLTVLDTIRQFKNRCVYPINSGMSCNIFSRA